jgi:quercetin dioxygenase-like cupin family protein
MKSFIGLFITLNLLGSAYAKDDQHGQVITKLVIQSGDNWAGEALPPYLTSPPQISLMRYTIPPRTALPVHKHPAINAAYVMEGDLTVIKEGGGEKVFHKGDAIIEMVDQWHHGENRGDKPVELIVFYAGSKNLPLAIKKATP